MKRQSGSSDKGRNGEESGTTRFVPNLKQLQEALRHLPEPDECADDRFEFRVSSGGRHDYLSFVRAPIQRGKRRTYRWIYEGKLLIRKRDIATTDED